MTVTTPSSAPRSRERSAAGASFCTFLSGFLRICQSGFSRSRHCVCTHATRLTPVGCLSESGASAAILAAA
eukprot:6492777-Prymnesium_polylepis.1